MDLASTCQTAGKRHLTENTTNSHQTILFKPSSYKKQSNTFC